MKKLESVLVLIYHFTSSNNQNGEWRPASYRLVHAFSADGFLPKGDLRELAKSVPEADHDSLSFMNLEGLKDFGLRVCQEQGHREVRLISVQDYNIGIDGARDRSGFREIFCQFGETARNDQDKKKGFLGKLFK